MKQSYLFLADGFEEIEALATVDILRRASMDVVTVSVMGRREVTGANGVVVVADRLIADVELGADTEWLICPGGMPGATNLAACDKLCDMLKAHHAAGGCIAAICASPAIVLAPLGVIGDRSVTCYPGMESCAPGQSFTGCAVEAHPTLVTGNGPANTLPFAYAIVAASKGEATARTVASAMQYAG